MPQTSSRPSTAGHPPRGTTIPCAPCRGETMRHRVITADGHDVIVTTVETSSGFLTGAYPIQYGYQVMICQPICEKRAIEKLAADDEHNALVSDLANLGVSVVRARRKLAARARTEQVHVTRERTAERTHRTPAAAQVAVAL